MGMDNNMIRKNCIHYRYFGDYSLDQCFKDAGLPNFKVETEFDCRNCKDFRTKSGGLEKCPFCHGKPIISKEHDIGNEWRILCRRCRLEMRGEDVNTLVEKWNNRKDKCSSSS